MSIKKEVWKNIPNYEKEYQASNLGRIKSLERKVKCRGNGYRIVNEKILKYGIDENGYRIVSLAKEGKSKTHSIHQLIAITFLNHKPNGHKLVIDHIDMNRQNNNLENLRIVSNRDNIMNTNCQRVVNPKGVTLIKKTGKYRSVFMYKGKTYVVGTFETKEEAIKQYKIKRKEICK